MNFKKNRNFKNNMFKCPECGDEVTFIYTETDMCVDCFCDNNLEEMEEIKEIEEFYCDQCLAKMKRSVYS